MLFPLRRALHTSVPRRAFGLIATKPVVCPPTPHLLDELDARGFIQSSTSPELRKHLDAPSCVYVGVDPSASSLHVGNLLPLLGLLHFRARGHHALALIGGATGAIGDPSGRSTERNALSEEQLAVNVAGITSQVERFFERGIAYAQRHGYDLDEATAATLRGRGFDIVNNHDWFKDISFLSFLRDVGKLARVNTMLARDSVKSRLDSEQGISFTEFSYQLLQAHDFATLYKNHGCRVQLGGSDQWGNIVAGIDMIKRVRAQEAAAVSERAKIDAINPNPRRAKQEAKIAAQLEKQEKRAEERAAARGIEPAHPAPQPDPAYGLTMPLLTTSSGEKFGKSAGNAVWLDTDRTSVSDFWQFFFRSTDADVGKYLSLLTFVPPSKIADVMTQHEREPRKRLAQRLLADEVTELVHGPEGVRRAHAVANILYHRNPRELTSAEVEDAMLGDRRFVRVHRRDLKGKPVSKLAVMYGLAESRSEANRLIKPRNSGMSINELQVMDPRREIERTDLIDKHLAILRKGTKDMIVFYVETDPNK